MSPCKPLYTPSRRTSSPSDTVDNGRLDTSLLRHLRLLVAATVDYCEPLEDENSQPAAHSSQRTRVQNRAALSSKLLVASIQNAAATFLNSINVNNEGSHVRPLV